MYAGGALKRHTERGFPAGTCRQNEETSSSERAVTTGAADAPIDARVEVVAGDSRRDQSEVKPSRTIKAYTITTS